MARLGGDPGNFVTSGFSIALDKFAA